MKKINPIFWQCTCCKKVYTVRTELCACRGRINNHPTRQVTFEEIEK
jgi:hypothetical protein